ncbi:hypothetical protein [Streptomyces ficellus]|uniref:Integral membrane protein n=1 Tax=Streptomyces ficellus TaxID=1977088 RepID=A0A6I6EZV0_9ACTN|nr:hypothetical protein [Streptomyces ficellus]QGV76980.1 hypothetical protein EIZ62_00955 [Streptomyces ficellus]
MAGTEPVDAGDVDDDALYVLTAVLLTPAQFPSLLGDDYPEACAALGLEPYAEGYGLVLGQDGTGARWTVVIDDVSLVAVAVASWDCGMEYDLSPDERSMVVALPGWPIALAVAAPHVPAPHDPPTPPGERPPLRPPDPDEWGPAQRRMGADAVALQWTAWREQLGDDALGKPADPDTGVAAANGTAPGAGVVASANGTADVGTKAARAESASPGALPGEEAVHPLSAAGVTTEVRQADGREDAEPVDDSHGRLRRILAELRGYLEEPPPAGRVRSGFAPGGARTLRADGPGWSVVARTDDVAFVLLDEMPREVLPIGRGPNLPTLLAALDSMAARPA